jgi:hypothetical protein
MFFDTNKVNNALLCKQCEGRLDIPKIIPCGETICSFCETSIQVNENNTFDCLICKDKHEMPKNGFLISKALSEILSIKLTKVSRGKSFDLLKRSLDNMLKKRNYIELGIENSTDFVKEYCIELRNDAQLATEDVIQQINDINEETIDEIDEYEKELIEFNKTRSDSLDSFNNTVKRLEAFHASNTEYLNQNEVDDETVVKSNEEATSLIKKADIDIQNLKYVIFDGNILKFERKIQKIINKSIFNISKSVIIDSLILSDKNLIKNLLSLCEITAYPKWNLIYRASRDGFEAAKFHSKCDNKPNTLIVIKSTNGNIFGGYTEQSWFGSGYKTDSNAFVFSLINSDSKPVKIKWSRNQGIGCDISHGPIFGAGHDLFISDKSNTNTSSLSNLCNSYIHPEYEYKSNGAKSFLAGSYNFQVLETEVFSK